MLDAIVIGAGITGLSCGYALKTRSFSTLVLESNKAGGLVQSKHKDGFTLECGPNVFLEKPLLMRLIKDLGIESLISRPAVRFYEQHVWHYGAPHVVPRGPLKFYQTELIESSYKWPILKGVLTGLAPSSEKDDCTVAEYLEPLIGAKAVSSLLAPALKGVYGGSIKELSARSVFPGFWEAGKQGLKLREYLKERRKENGRPRVFSLKGGISVVASKLIEFCEKKEILRQAAAVNLTKSSDSFLVALADGEVLKARRVFVTTSGPQSSVFLRSMLPGISEKLDAVTYIPLIVVHLAVESDYRPLPKSFGILYPSTPERNLMGVMFNSQLFPHLAPKGRALLTVMLGGSEGRGIMVHSDEEIMNIVRRELKETLGYEDAELLNIKRWQAAIPHYPLGHYKLVDALREAEERCHGLHFLGTDIGSPGIGDRVSIAIKAVDAL